MLRQAAECFFAASDANPHLREYGKFCAEQAAWLDDYALFMAIKDAYGGVAWTEWEPDLAARPPRWLGGAKNWLRRLRHTSSGSLSSFGNGARCAKRVSRRGIRIMGDVPIYVAHDSADVWTAPRTVPAGRAGQSPECRRGSAGLFQRDRPVVGQSDLSLGQVAGGGLPLVDGAAAGRYYGSSTSCGLITFAASRRTLRFLRARRRR